VAADDADPELLPTFQELRTQFRLLGGDARLRIACLSFSHDLLPEGRGIGPLLDEVLKRDPEWDPGAWQGIGGRRVGTRDVGRWLVPFLSKASGLWGGGSASDLHALLKLAGARLDRPATPEAGAWSGGWEDPDVWAWMDHLYASAESLHITVETYKTIAKTNWNEDVAVDVREIRNVMAASVAAIDRQIAGAAPRRGRKPAKESGPGRVRELLLAKRGIWFSGEKLKKETVPGRPLAGLTAHRAIDYAGRAFRKHPEEFERRERRGDPEYRAKP
jgi:hypothetical protein